MASFDVILVPAQAAPSKITSLAATTSSAEVAFGSYQVIAINATQDVTVRFGPPGLGAADASFFRLPANTTNVFDVGRDWTSVRFYNLSGSTAADIYIQPLSKI